MRGYAGRKRFSKKDFRRGLRGVALLVFFFVIIKLAVSLGEDTLAGNFLSKIVTNANVAEMILGFELGTESSDTIPEIKTLFWGVPDGAPEQAEYDSEVFENPFSGHTPNSPPPTEPDSKSQASEGALFFGGALPSEKPTPDTSPPQILHPPIAADSIEIENGAGYDVDIPKLLNDPLNFELDHEKPSVLIIHTHSSEAYTPDGNDRYEASDPYRTENNSQSIIRIGDELAKEFESRGINVIHDRSSYDYPSYSGSYGRSYTSIESYLKKYPSIKIVLDVHRDAISASDGSQYKTIAHIGDTICSQVMMVVGTDSSGLTHPRWRENLKLAVKLQNEMNSLAPSLTRPIRLSQYRYNQQATTGSLIIEIGCAGNTLQESLSAVKYFAEAAANVITPQHAK